MSIKQIYRKYVNYLDNASQRLRVRKQYVGEWIDVLWGKDAKLIKDTTLSKDEIEQIQTYWKKQYGKKIPLYWHKRYKGYSGVFDVRYFPEIFYTTKLEPKLQADKISRTLNDKALIEVLFARVLDKDMEVRVPKTILGCANSFCYDENRIPISKEMLIEKMENLQGEFIIKPTIGESSGRGVKLLKLDTKEHKEIKNIIDEYGDNFIVQEKIILNDSYAQLHPNSVNTIRIMTYRTENQIKYVPVIVRIGCGGSHLDNAHAGGIYVAVNEDGSMGKYAMNCQGEKYEGHPDTGIAFADVKLPLIDKAIEKALVLHTCLPELAIVNWDLCIDDCNRVVLIEANMSCGSFWMFQNAHGKAAFGEDTNYMIEKMREHNI